MGSPSMHHWEGDPGNGLASQTQGALAAELPLDRLLGSCPLYQRDAVPSEKQLSRQKKNAVNWDVPDDIGALFKEMIVQPELASKRWVYRTIRLDGKDLHFRRTRIGCSRDPNRRNEQSTGNEHYGNYGMLNSIRRPEGVSRLPKLQGM